MGTEEPKKLADRVDDFVGWLFESHITRLAKESKVINDALLGNQYFAPHEIAVIDTPLLQRLKHIKQTGLVCHVFPSATHSRFEHCLGAATLAERCFNAVLDRASVETGKLIANSDRLSGDLAHLRMAALLHDVGHGLCSHASEQIYSLMSDLKEFKTNPVYTKNQPGEILSYLIVKSRRFTDWFEDVVVRRCGAKLNLERVGKMILGKDDDKDRTFLAQIISSPYDADKLDYIARDSYYCGLALTVDLARFYGMISTVQHNGERILVLRNYVPLEQILFSKMTLFGSVYHHQKVKCLDSMLRSLVQHIVQNADQCALDIRGARITFADPVQYLYTTDDEFLNQFNGFGDEYTKKMLARLRQRDLFVRCVEISRRTVKNWSDYARLKHVKLATDPDKLDEIEKDIHKRLPATTRGQSNVGDVRLSVPRLPSLSNDFAFVQTSQSGPVEKIEEFFPVGQWVDAYTHNKWRSYVYAPREIAEAVRDSAIEALQDRIDMKIDVTRSNQACHLT